jgi:hypothetical protein
MKGFQSDGSSFFGLFTRREIFQHLHLVGGVGERLMFLSPISEADQVAPAFRRIGEEPGPVDLLINNASASGPFRQPFVEITPGSFTRGLASWCS